jgi:hypothetical protein
VLNTPIVLKAALRRQLAELHSEPMLGRPRVPALACEKAGLVAHPRGEITARAPRAN